jgi:hypothetical protein
MCAAKGSEPVRRVFGFKSSVVAVLQPGSVARLQSGESSDAVSAFLIDRATANDGAEDARFGELGGRDLGEIVR